jgi:hypothetical protein
MVAAWQLVYDAAAQMGNGAPWPEDTRGADAAAIEQVIQFAQRDFTRHKSTATHATLLVSLEPDSPAEARTLARLRSCSACASSAALDALPTGPTMVLSDSDATSMLRFGLGLMTLPTTALGMPCACGRRLLASEADHALTCKSLNGAVTVRHDNPNKIVCRAARRAGVASSVEPQLRQLKLAAEQAGRRGRQAQGDGARGDALLAMPEGMLITDVVVVHPAAQSYLEAAARTDGTAATDREAFKVQKFRASADTGAYAFEAMGVETYGRLGAGTMRLINRLVGIAAESGKVDKGALVAYTLREMSVGLARYNGMLFRGGLKVMARVTGRMFQAGQPEPSAD